MKWQYVLLMVAAIAIVVVRYILHEQYEPQYLFWKSSPFTTETLTDIYACSENELWIAGSAGSLFKTTDQAESWNCLRSPEGSEIHDLFFLNESDGFAAGGKNGLILTRDGGKKWEVRHIGDETFDVQALWFLKSGKGFAGGSYPDSDYSAGHSSLYHTVDRGETWITSQCRLISVSSLFFVDDSCGFACGPEGLAMTRNAGHTWSLVSSDKQCNYSKCFFTDWMNGYTCGTEKGMLRTSNGGRTWMLIEAAQKSQVNCIYFLDKQQGWAAGNDGLFLCTADGGENWHRLETGVIENFFEVVFVSSACGVICGDNGTLIKVEAQ